MNLYLWLDIAVFAAPFALSFDRRVAYFRRWPPLLGSILVVSSTYIFWDVLATRAGHWSFSEEYAGGFRVLGLPLGELLFFFVVPYACIFVYEVVRAYFPLRAARTNGWIRPAAIGVAAAFTAAAVVFRGQEYTFLALLSCAVFLLLGVILGGNMFAESHTWWYLLISYVPFIIANGVLTGIPIVTYGQEAIWGIRVVNIPLEDFFYNLGMLGLYLLVHYRLRPLFDRRAPAKPEGGG
jgi:lycopene cyclase domain-containing protein